MQTDTAPITAFIAKANREGRASDAAWGTGVLDGVKGLECNAQIHGFGLELHEETSLGRAYLSGWCKANGF